MAGSGDSKRIDFFGQLFTGELLSFDGQSDDVGGIREVFFHALRFFVFDLAYYQVGGAVRRLLIRHFHDFQFAVAAQPFAVFFDRIREKFFFDLSHAEDSYFHRYGFLF